MGIALSEDDLWRFVAEAETGIVTTLRRDGRPVALPVWHVAIDRRIYFKTYATMPKANRIRRDPRASFVVQDGRRWTELRAVSLEVAAQILPAGEEERRAREALAQKYPREINVPMERLPPASRAYYGSADVIVRLAPVGTPISWDNRRLRLLPEDGSAG